MRSFRQLFLLITLVFGGCYPEPLNYKPGWGTRFIEGTVLEDSREVLKSKGFIVVLEYYSQFIEFENESPLYAPKARLIFPTCFWKVFRVFVFSSPKNFITFFHIFSFSLI